MSLDRCLFCDKIVDTDVDDLYREMYGDHLERAVKKLGDVAPPKPILPGYLPCCEHCFEMHGFEENGKEEKS